MYLKGLKIFIFYAEFKFGTIFSEFGFYHPVGVTKCQKYLFDKIK